jgi:hypothetical protein
MELVLLPRGKRRSLAALDSPPGSLLGDRSSAEAAVAARDLRVMDRCGGDPRPGRRHGGRPSIHPCHSYSYSHDTW